MSCIKYYAKMFIYFSILKAGPFSNSKVISIRFRFCNLDFKYLCRLMMVVVGGRRSVYLTHSNEVYFE